MSEEQPTTTFDQLKLDMFLKMLMNASKGWLRKDGGQRIPKYLYQRTGTRANGVPIYRQRFNPEHPSYGKY
jgi:hypothetical protein|tara:strand:- start:173 stop:385 length:213 start_codon:yes stop_codon:yes gene_type:complete